MTPDPGHKGDQPLTEAIRELSEIVRVVMTAQEQQTQTQDRMLRRDLRWRNLRAALLCVAVVGGALIYSLGLQKVFAPAKFSGPYAALVRIEGLIDADQRANAHRVNSALRSAFEDEKARGVVVLVNSPGGSPVQSALIHDRLVSLRERFPNKPLWVIGEDMLTSGAYFVAVASNNVCVNRSTMVGSIGVLMSGWGFDRTIERYGIERRVMTAGANKNRLDAFSPLRTEDREKAQALLTAVHAHFIDVVKAGRGERLKGDPKRLFSGDYWTGEEAKEFGLVDGLCDLNSIIGQLGVDQVKDYTTPPNVWTALANSFGVTAENWLARTQTELRLLP